MLDSDLVAFDHLSEPRSGSTPVEVFRAVFSGRTPDGDPNALIVTRQGQGRDGRVWLTFAGALRTTVALTRDRNLFRISLLAVTSSSWFASMAHPAR